MPLNLELKARLASVEAASESARRAGASDAGVLRQVDTYFLVPRGRLKLRTINDASAELIQYERANDCSARLSLYRKVAVDDLASLRAMLADALGIDVEVRKERKLFLLKGTRIHLDRVASLGTFIEFEVPASDPADAEKTMAALKTMFAIEPREVIGVSYADLLREQSQRSPSSQGGSEQVSIKP